MSDVIFFKARNGTPSASINNITLHSRFNPAREAERFAREIHGNPAVIILEGLGLGYVAEALLEHKPHQPVIVVESDESWPSHAASSRNLDKLFQNPRFTLLCGGNPRDIVSLLKNMGIRQDIALVPWRPSIKLNPEWYSKLENHMHFYLQRQEVNRKTLDRFGELWIRNISANLPHLGRAIPLTGWEGYFLDIPALIIAGGPSLDKHLPDIASLRESHLLIAVDTAMTALAKTQIKPDIIAALDPQYWNTRHLDRCRKAAGEALILSEIASHPGIFRSLDGRPWLTRTHFPLAGKLEDAAGIHGRLRAGGSVATAAWDLGRFLGCSPICATGLDLGFPGGKTHYTGSLSQTLPHLSAIRTAPAENLFHRLLHNPHTHPAKAMDGSTLITDIRMDIYAAWFTENSPPQLKPGILGLQGRQIKNIKPKTIKELLKNPPCRPKINQKLEEIKKTAPKKHLPREILQIINQTLVCLESLQTLACQGQALAKKGTETVANAARNPGNTALILKRLENIDQKILNIDGREIISFLIQPIIREIESETPAAEDWQTSMEKSASLYEKIAESAARQLQYLKPAAKKLTTHTNQSLLYPPSLCQNPEQSNKILQ